MDRDRPLEFRVLGPVEVISSGVSIPLGGPRQRALLALLLLNANESVSTNRLIDDLWSGDAPESGTSAIQNQVARLRKAIGADRIATRQSGYSIIVAAGELDLDRHRLLVAKASAEGPEKRSALLTEADSLWHGEALAGLPDAPFVVREQGRLENLRLATLEDRIDADLELGRHAELVGELSGLAASYPLQERLRGQLMLALYRSGRQAEALDVYRETRTLLAEELALEPSQTLRSLEHAVLAQDPSLDPPARTRERRMAEEAPAAVEPEAISRRYRAAVIVLAVGLLGAAGVLTAFALGREPASRAAAPTTVLPTLPFARTASATTDTAPMASEQQAADTAAESSSAPTTVTTTTPPPAATAPIPAANATTQSPSGSSTTKSKTSGRVAKRTPKSPGPATTTTTPPPSTGPATTTPATESNPLKIEDAFDSSRIDPTIWHSVFEGTGSDLRQQGGQIVVMIAAEGVPGGAYNVLGAHVGTQCKFPGDFDARADFTLLEWWAATNVRAGLSAYYADSFVGRLSSSTWGDQYASWVAPANGSVPLDEMAGSLRIARVGSTVTTYFWHNGRWVPLASGPSTGTAVLGLEAATGADFGHRPIRVAFDNFSVVATNVACPPGSAPPGA